MGRPKWDVFISYSSKDSDPVSVITADLRNEGFKVWQDQSAMLPGERLREAIHEGLQNSACILVLISQNSLRSKWVINELDAAMLREMREGRSLVIPVLLGKINPASLPHDIQGKKYVDLRHNFSKKYQQHRSTIINVVRLASSFDTSALRDEVSIGNEAVAMLLTKDFPTWVPYINFVDDLLVFIFDKERKWPEGMELGKEFINYYGHEAASRVLMLALDDSEVDPTGFKVEELEKVVHLFMLFAWLTMAHETFVATNDDIRVGMNEKGKISFRLAKANS